MSWNYGIRENSEGFQLQDVQHQQRWGGDLELASSPFFLQEGLWGSDLELASPGGFDSCIMDSSWTSSKEHCTPPCQGPGLDSVPSPTSSVVSVRNLSHHGSQGLLTARIQQQQQQPLIESHVDVSSSSSVGSLFNRASISDPEQQHAHKRQRSSKQRSNGGDESVGSPFPGFSNKKGSVCASGDQNELSGEINDRKRSNQQRGPSERMMEITLEELSRYFTMPITQASKELKVGLTVLKKRCREFGIPRWPHRKLKSLESLIHKSQELAKDSEGKAPNPVMNAVQELEKQKRRMEQSPKLELDERTKRFRQAIFKASYKQRRRAISKDSQTTATSDSNNNEDIHDTV